MIESVKVKIGGILPKGLNENLLMSNLVVH